MVAVAKNISMEELEKKIPDFTVPTPGTLVEGAVISMFKSNILVDIDGLWTGIISGREAKDSDDTVKGLKSGDKISAYVIEEENDEGYIVLSLRKATQERTWNRFNDAYENKDIISVKASEANKGGLLLDIDGIKGFIPVSQLAPMHYPRVNDADSGQILKRLQELIGIQFKVKIINIDKENGKLILSEKAAMEDQRKETLKGIKVGDVVKGKISGIVKFGIFVAFEGLEGLVHISEIAWGHVKNPGDYGQLGHDIEVQVIGIENEKISLSMKRLVSDPWSEAAKKYKIGSIVDGEVNRLTPFGVFVKLDNEINGLIHITEISEEEVTDPADHLNIGDKVKAKVIAVEPDEHRVGLSIKALSEKKSAKKEASEEEVSETELEKPKKKIVKKKALKKNEEGEAEEEVKKIVKKRVVKKKAVEEEASETKVAA